MPFCWYAEFSPEHEICDAMLSFKVSSSNFWLQPLNQVLEGGLRDKPGKNRDHYHSCYCLSGLSVSQYSATTDSDSCPLPQHVLGPYSNLLEPIHPLYNVVLDKYHTAYEFFSQEWWCEILEQSWLRQMSDCIVCTDSIGPKYCDITLHFRYAYLTRVLSGGQPHYLVLMISSQFLLLAFFLVLVYCLVLTFDCLISISVTGVFEFWCIAWFWWSHFNICDHWRFWVLNKESTIKMQRRCP